MTGLARIFAERKRQRSRQGEQYSAGHDDSHHHGELALMAALYAVPPERRDVSLRRLLSPGWRFKDTDRLDELAKAGALIAAEIDRLERLVGGDAADE